jgi:hypothetical protein
MFKTVKPRTRQFVVALVLAFLVLSQLLGTLYPRPRPAFLSLGLGFMQRLTGAAGQFTFFAGPLTSRLTQRYGNVEVVMVRAGQRTLELLTRRLSAGQAQQLRVYLAADPSPAQWEALLARVARFVLSKEADLEGLTLRVVYRDATLTPLQTHIAMERSYAVPLR